MKRIAVLLILLSFSITFFAQSEREWIEYGDAAFKKEDYTTALSFYLKIGSKETVSDYTRPYEVRPYFPPPKATTSNTTIIWDDATPYSPSTHKDSLANKVVTTSSKEQYVTHQIADSYRLNHDYKNAEIWFQKSVATNPSQYPYESYWYGDALMKNEKYTLAFPQFNAAMHAAEKKDSLLFNLAKNKIAGCYLAIDNYIDLHSNNPQKDIVVSELDSVVNNGTSSFAVNYYGDQNTIQYTVAREGNTITDSKTQKAEFTCDIYTLGKTATGWNNLKKIEIPINTGDQEGAGFITSAHKDFFFTRWSATNKTECAIYISKLYNDKWLGASKMNDNVNLAGYKSMQPSLSADGHTLYFSSNRPGGLGKMDLWYIKLDDDGKTVGSAINMGPLINTTEDEVSPFFHDATSTLYFSSDGHPGFGGLDVFRSSLSDSFWSAPRNIGALVNSSKDDAYFILDRSQRTGFLTSDRKDCKTCTGGACYKVYSVDKKPNVFDIKGIVYNSETNEVVPNALVTFKDIHGDKEPFYLITDATGNYFTAIEQDLEFYIKAQKNRFLGDAGNISTIGLTESQHFEKDFFLSPIPIGDITIEGIEYDYNKATLRPESKKKLDELVDFLNLNNNLTVEIGSHTDERGSDVYNMKLSQERAKSCVDYLISKGIAAERLVGEGYGETKLLIPHAATEEEHQKNRRTIFRTIKEGEIRSTK